MPANQARIISPIKWLNEEEIFFFFFFLLIISIRDKHAGFRFPLSLPSKTFNYLVSATNCRDFYFYRRTVFVPNKGESSGNEEREKDRWSYCGR